MPADFDLDAYFERIDYTGPRASTLEALSGLHLAHTRAIPFENLNPLLGRPVRLDLESLGRKLVHEGRGGYCFEQNLLFRHVLERLGFRVTGLAARVLWNAPEGAITMRSHMVLCVDVGGLPYVADVGFGGQTLTGPLRLERDVEQATPHEPFRLLESDGGYLLQSKIDGEWRPLYRFDLQAQHAIDYEAVNYYLSTHPSSIFTTTLRVARPAHDRRHALLNNVYAVHHANAETERRSLTSVAEMRQALVESFRLRLPEGPELDTALESILAGEPATPSALWTGLRRRG
jgi:N-hydroxyarylamine O-acetyltransferase